MNKLRFILMVFCSSVILLVTAQLSAGVSYEPYISTYDIQDDYPEVPSLSQPSDLKKNTDIKRADETRLIPLKSLDSKQATNGLSDYMSNYSFAQATAAKTDEASKTSGKPQAKKMTIEELQELSRKMDNPLSDLWIIFNQNDTSIWRGTPARGKKVINMTTIQPILPVNLTKNWNLVNRPIIPIISAPEFDIPGRPGLGANPGLIPSQPRFNPFENLRLSSDREVALGDIMFWTMLSPVKPTKGVIWGVGPSFMFPTATRNQFGTEKFSIGPSNVIMTFPGKWTIGIFHQHFFSIGGEDDRESVKMSQVQPILFYNLPKLWTVGMAPMWTANWKASSDDVFTIPVGLEVQKTTILGGKLPVRIGAGVHYSVLKPDNYGQRWNFRLYFVPVIPNLLKMKLKDKPLFGR